MVLLGLGNPLLDIVASVPATFISENGLKVGEAVLATPQQLALFSNVKNNFDCRYLSGGATQNTIRIYQALQSEADKTLYMGCVGDDEDGQTLEKLLRTNGVVPLYQISKEKSTGKCLVLIQDKERTLCTTLGACTDLCIKFVDEHMDSVNISSAIYMAGYFLSTSVEIAFRMAKHCKSQDKLFCMNISAPFLVDQYNEDIVKLLPMCNILFGNREEYVHLAKRNNINYNPEVSMGDIAYSILHMMLGENCPPQCKKMAVITQGCNPVIIATRDGETTSVCSYPVPHVKPEDIKDLNGAGDAFVGGFLYGLIDDRPISLSVGIGNYCAAKVIQNIGCFFDFSDRDF